MKNILKAIAVFFFIITIVLAAGCTEKIGSKGKSKANTNLITEQVVTEADSGKTISLNKGEKFTVSLKEEPSTGYLWELNLSNGLSIYEDTYIESLNPQHIAGIPGTHLWIIEATSPGSQKVTGIYKKSWKNPTGTEKKFTLTVEVE
jgi:inhibitor of cysteine peptidase